MASPTRVLAWSFEFSYFGNMSVVLFVIWFAGVWLSEDFDDHNTFVATLFVGILRRALTDVAS